MGISQSTLDQEMEEIHYATFKDKKKLRKSNKGRSSKQKSSNSDSSQKRSSKHSQKSKHSQQVQPSLSSRGEEEHEPSMESSSRFSTNYSDTMFEASRKVDKNIWSAAEQLLEALTAMKGRSTKIVIDSEHASSESSSSKKLHQLPRWVPEPSPPTSPTVSARVDSLTGIITIPASSLSGPELHGKGLFLSPKNSPVHTPTVSRRGSKKNLMPTIRSALNFGDDQLDGNQDDYSVGISIDQ